MTTITKTVKVANNMQLFDEDGYHYNRCLTLDIKSFNKFLVKINQLLKHEKGYSSDRIWLESLPTKQSETGIVPLTLTQTHYLIMWLKSNGYVFKGHKIKREVNTVVKLF